MMLTPEDEAIINNRLSELEKDNIKLKQVVVDLGQLYLTLSDTVCKLIVEDR